MLPNVGELCANVPDNIRPLVEELAENVFFMHGKLVETRGEMLSEKVAVPYDNGGGQTGIRENPAFKGYGSLLTQYRSALKDLVELLERYGGFEPGDGDTPLAKILAEAEGIINGE